MNLRRFARNVAYNLAGWYGEKFERNHLRIAFFELAVTGYAVWHFFQEMKAAFVQKEVQFDLDYMEGHWLEELRLLWSLRIDFAETLVFSMMFCLVLSSLVIQFRRSRLGYSFRRLLQPGKVTGVVPRGDALFETLLEAAHDGHHRGHPCLADVDPRVRWTVVEQIAQESASMFSIRARHDVDHVWATWEAFYLNDWQQEFPGTIWQVPSDATDAPAWHGYFSVIVPITEAAWHRVRRGHLSTALAPIDPRAAAFWADPARRDGPAFADPLYFLAYAHLYVGRRGDTWDRFRLLCCSIEHLAALIAAFYPDAITRRHSSFTLICESANATQDALFGDLGLEPVTQEIDEAGQMRLNRVISPAGFQLFELRVINGSPVPHNDMRLPAAEGFLSLILEFATRMESAAVSETVNG